MSGGGEDAGEVIFEVRRLDAIQRVAAIHVASGTEVVVQAPAAAALVDVQALALRKLRRMLNRKKSAGDGPGNVSRRGTII